MKREHPDWPHKRIVAAVLNNARRTTPRGKQPSYLRRAQGNPSSGDYWLGFGIVAAGLVALGIAARYPKARQSVIGV